VELTPVSKIFAAFDIMDSEDLESSSKVVVRDCWGCVGGEEGGIVANVGSIIVLLRMIVLGN